MGHLVTVFRPPVCSVSDPLFFFFRPACETAARVPSCWWTPKWSTRSPSHSARPPSPWKRSRSPPPWTWASSPGCELKKPPRPRPPLPPTGPGQIINYNYSKSTSIKCGRTQSEKTFFCLNADMHTHRCHFLSLCRSETRAARPVLSIKRLYKRLDP